MSKNSIIIILTFQIIILIGGSTFLFISNQDEKLLNVISKREVNIIERSQQYKLLYSINLQNSLKPDCNWENVTYSWNFPSHDELDIFKTSITTNNLEENTSFEKETFSKVGTAISEYLIEYPEVEEALYYDYEVEIFSDEVSSYDKMPLFQDMNDIKIYSSNLTVWRDVEGKYIAGLYESINGYRVFDVDTKNPYFSFPIKSQDEIKEDISNVNIKFLNHEFLCEDNSIDSIEIESAEIVFINIGEYLVPVYKIIGTAGIKSTEIKWTAILNPIDYKSLDYTIYEDPDLATFIPKPYVNNVNLSDGKYRVSGKLANKLKGTSEKESKTADSVSIKLIAKEKSGEYFWGERKKVLDTEIDESLEVNDDGEFTFSFSSENYWKVEQVYYEDEDGNSIEAYHSSDIEIDRWSYDNWFRIEVCSTFEDKEYCSDYSNVEFLEK